MIHRNALLLLVTASLLAACGQDAPRGDPLTGGAPPAGAPGAQNPHGMPDGMPAGHPPMPGGMGGGMGAGMGGGMGGSMAPAPREADFGWTVPDGWTETPPASPMRIAQFDLDAKWPDGLPVQCALFPAIGGGKQANIDRWAGQFSQQDGSASKDKLKVTETTSGDVTVTRIELLGSFSDGMVRPPRETADGMLLGAIVETKDGANLYVKLTGPREALESETAQFDAFVKSLHVKK